MTFTLYDLIYFFIIYSVLGWCIEVSYHSVTKGIFVNRGFLNGPVCPIYGVGFTVVVICLTPLESNFFLLFVGSVLLTTLLEFITGFVLEKIFHEKWWDYSKEKFNIKGYVCLRFSLIWGAACALTMYFVQPLIIRFVHFIPYKAGITVIIISAAAFVSDITVTVAAIKNIYAQLRIMDEITMKLKKISDSIGEEISEKTIEMVRKTEKGRDEYEELRKKYQMLRNERTFVHKRLSKAFPHLKLEKKYHFSGKLKNDILSKIEKIK
ncbi:MAG: hypothetical protein Q4F95_07120 [Oscillospiraceae bacterium]|nr:hypothetical protein [Oscillospiraceae bacterium]